MTTQNTAPSTSVTATSAGEPDTATAVPSAIRIHAVTSSKAAAASTTAPIGRLSMRRSTRIRASTGNAVIDIEMPRNSAKGRKSVSGASCV